MNVPKPDSLMLVLPVPFQHVGNEIYFEEQACNGLRLWLENFGSLNLCCPEIISVEPPAGYISLNGLLETGRITLYLLPHTGSRITFLKALPKGINQLRRAIRQSLYIQCAIGGLTGDWGAIAIITASRMKRKVAVWTDSVASSAVASYAQGKGIRRRLYLKAVAAIMARYEHYVIARAAVGLFHGKDTFDAYSAWNRDPHLVHDIHIGPEYQISSLELSEKKNRPVNRPLSIIYAGRVHRDKGVLEWLDTLALARDRGVSFSATWFGDGPQLEEGKASAILLNLSDTVSFPGPLQSRSELMKAIRAADIFLFCHKIPESPRCLIEALICGTPIVGFRSSYAADLISEHQGGLLTDMDPKPLAAALEWLHRDGKRLAELMPKAAAEGRNFVDETVFRHRSDLIKSAQAK